MESFERYRWLIVGLLAAPLLIAIGFLIENRQDNPAPLVLDLTPASVRVYIIGEVQRPGVYTLPGDARWIDALEASGGPTADADLFRVNLARQARDEDQIIVPKLGEAAPASGAATLVNINTANASQLDALPGIGEVRSQRIIDSRNSKGVFGSPEELVTRELIPQSVFDEIQSLITTGP